MKTSVTVPNRQPNYVTPYFPKGSIETAKRWERERGMPVLILAFDRVSENQCPNCAGVGMLYMKLCEKGPIGVPADARNVYTWFDGNERFKRGWYKVAETLVIECPECKKKAA